MHIDSQQVWLPTQDQANQYQPFAWGGAQESLLLANKLLTVDGF